MIYFFIQKTEPATKKSPTGKIVIPMKKLCTTEIIPSALQKYFKPPPRNNLTPHPDNLNLTGKFYCHLPKYLNHPGLQPSQPNYLN